MTSRPPKISGREKFPTRLAVILCGALALPVVATVFFLDPAQHRFFPGCTFHQLTGLNCPGCGATRALHALLHGDFLTAAHDNALLPAGIIFLGARGGWLALNRWRGQQDGKFFPLNFLWPRLAVALVFGILRNLPAFRFLSP